MDRQARSLKVSSETAERMQAASAGFGIRLARCYFLSGGILYAAPTKVGELRSTNPLADPDFFLSFAHCEAGPSAALAWTKAYGLLTTSKNRFGDPITVPEFLKEVEKARRAMDLYADIRAADADSLRGLITRERISPDDGPPGRFAHAFVHGTDAHHVVDADGEADDETAFSVAVNALRLTLEEKLSGLRYSLAYSSERGLSLGGYALVPDWGIPDLLTAAWFQFSLIVADSRPLHTCPYCGKRTPILRGDDKQTCGGDRCKKANQRHKKRSR